MVKKYSCKRPEVIAVGIENPAAVLSDELNSRLSDNSRVGFEIPALRKMVDAHPKGSQLNRMQAEGGNGHQQNLQVDGIEVEELPEEDTTTLSSNYGERLPLDSEDSDEFWKSFVTPASPVDNLVTDNKVLVLQEEQPMLELEEDGNESGDNDSSERSSSQPKPSKGVKRNKWKLEEVKAVIKMRGKLHSRFQVVKGRMALRKEISTHLTNEGFNRSPGQCRSLWTSLLQKYKESKSGNSQESWPFLEEMNKFLSISGSQMRWQQND